jgi:hypothetical protein
MAYTIYGSRRNEYKGATKMKKAVLNICLLALVAANPFSQQRDFPKLTGPYLGQKPPGMMPEVFAPGIVSKEGHQAKLFFTAGGLEAIYDNRDPANKSHFIWMRSNRGVWSEPVIISFSTEYINNEPCMSPDGKRLFFVSNRPDTPGGEAGKTPDIWMSGKTGDGWGEPVKAGRTINTPDIEVQPFWSSDGWLYFMRQSGGVRRQLLRSRLGDDQSAESVRLGVDLFQDQFSGVCLSPDNRILILHSRKEGGFGDWDLYVSFREPSGGWGKPINLGGPINTAESEGNATFSPNGEYLFFTRSGDIYWVSARLIERVRSSPGTPG